MHYPARKKGIYSTYSAGCITIYDRDDERTVLNHSATIIWQLSDGTKEVEEIINEIKNLFPESNNLDKQVLREDVFYLVDKGLLILSVEPTISENLLSICFLNFWHGFEIRKSYLLSLFMEMGTPVIVNYPDQCDVLIYYQTISPLHSSSISRPSLIGIFHKSEDMEAAPFDVALTTFHSTRPECISLPLYFLNSTTSELSSSRKNDLSSIARKIINGLNRYVRKEDINHSLNVLEIKENKPANQRPVRLTVGMAVYDDYDGVFFTIQAIRLYHQEVLSQLSFLIVDNHPQSTHGKQTQKFIGKLQNARYIPFEEYSSTSIKDILFREAETEFVLCIDSHVLLETGSIRCLLDYFKLHPDTNNLYQGPLVYDDLKHYSSSMNPEWRGGMYGTWKTDKEAKSADAEPFEIHMQGTGLMACRKETWPGFNARFRGFGGEEGYIHEKFKRAGHKTICLPFLRWIHRFGRPDGPKYRNDWRDRIRNYYIGFQELNWDCSPIDAHFSELLGIQKFNSIRQEILSELENPFLYFDAIFFITENMEDEIEKAFSALGILPLIRFISSDRHINSIRELCQMALKYKYRQILVFRDKPLISVALTDHLRKLLEYIQTNRWRKIYIGNAQKSEITSTLYDDSTINFDNNYKESCIIAVHHSQYELEIKQEKNTLSLP